MELGAFWRRSKKSNGPRKHSAKRFLFGAVLARAHRLRRFSLFYPSVTFSRRPRSLSFRLQSCPFGDNSSLEEFPQIDQQTPRQRDNSHLTSSRAPVGESFHVPPCQLALGLVTDPAPSQFNGNVAHVTVTGVADSLLAPAVAALVRRRCQTRQRSHLPPVAKLPPAKELSYQHPTPIATNAAQHRKLTHLVQVRTLLLFVRTLGLFHCAPAFPFQTLDLLLHKQRMLPLPLQAAL